MDAKTVITSSANPAVRDLAKLVKRASLRNRQDVFVCEGIKLFEEIPEESLVMSCVGSSFYESIMEEAGSGRDGANGPGGGEPHEPDQKAMKRRHQGKDAVRKKLLSAPYKILSDSVFETVSDTQTPQGILALVRQFHYEMEDILSSPTPIFMALEDIQDPGNLGTIFRSCEGAGVGGIIMSKGCADVYNPKVVRSTMGSVFRMPFIYCDDLRGELEKLKGRGFRLCAGSLDGTKSYDMVDYRKGRSIFMIGNESRGLSPQIQSLAGEKVLIPMKGQVESLNAALAASLLAFEAARQLRNV